MRPDADRWLALLEAVMAAESFETAAAVATHQFGEATQALAAGLFVVLHRRIYLEFWHPEQSARRAQLRAHFHSLAIQSAEENAPVVMPFPEQAATSLTPCVYLLPLKKRLTGVLCLAFPPQAGCLASGEAGSVERMVRLVATTLAGLQDIEAERRRSTQYERWFRVSDMQIRALDRERQKFAALVNSLDECVFVTDLSGRIRWTNRTLADRIPAPEPETTWIGRSCRELCGHAAGPGETACGTCPIAGALERGRNVRDAVVDDAVRPRDAMALPIRSLEGQAEEVIVVLRGLDQRESRRAA